MNTNTKTSKTRSDTAVQGTNDCSIVSKCSAARLGYFSDDFLQYFVAKESRRAPLINRGYFIRARIMKHSFRRFLNTYGHSANQVISLGAGFDSAFFNLKSEDLLLNTSYIEVDFPDLMRKKLALINSQHALKSLICSEKSDSGSDKVIFSSQNYKMLGVDLTQLNGLTDVLKSLDINFNIPTMLVSEVVLTYIAPKHSDSVISWAADTFPNSAFVMYEQILPNDAFGLVMRNHFVKIGSPLKCISQYSTESDQELRFKNAGWTQCKSENLNKFYHQQLEPEEREQIERLEPFDEFEEWHLKCAHYSFVVATKGFCNILMNEMFINTGPTSPLIEEQNITFLPSEMAIRALDVDFDFKAFGHTVSKINLNGKDLILIAGGFGEIGGKHARLKDIHLFDINFMSVINCQVENNSGCELDHIFQTATVLNDGRVILIGGRRSPTKPSSSVCALEMEPKPVESENNSYGQISAHNYCIKCKRLKETGEIPCLRWRHNAVLINKNGHEYIFVYGGRSVEPYVLGDCHILDTSTWEWTLVEPSGEGPGPLMSYGLSTYKDSIIFSGGLDENFTPVASIFQLNINDWTWKKLIISGNIVPRYSHTSSMIGHNVVLVGGVNLFSLGPGVAVINLETLTCHEYYLPATVGSGEINMCHNHGTVVLPPSSLLTVGGGGNCFSFGTHLNSKAVLINLENKLD